jgi:hypothetical protein
MLCSLGSPAAFPCFQGVRPLALRGTLSGGLPLSSYFKKRRLLLKHDLCQFFFTSPPSIAAGQLKPVSNCFQSCFPKRPPWAIPGARPCTTGRRPTLENVFKNAQFSPNNMCSNVNANYKAAYSEGEAVLAGSVGLKSLKAPIFR